MILRHLQVFLTTFAAIKQKNYNMRNYKKKHPTSNSITPHQSKHLIVSI